MRKRKHPITLIEILISLGLLALLLQTLFFWYHNAATSNQILKEQRWPVLEERFAEQRLHSILSKTNFDTYFFSLNDGPESIEGRNLVFTFDNGPQPHPKLSNTVLGRLYVDRTKHALCLGIWPHPKEKAQNPSQTLILLENVHDLNFQFYYPPNPFKKTVEPKEVGHTIPDEGWQSHWKKEFDRVPVMMKLSLTRIVGEKEYLLEMGFDFPASYHQIVYKDANS